MFKLPFLSGDGKRTRGGPVTRTKSQAKRKCFKRVCRLWYKLCLLARQHLIQLVTVVNPKHVSRIQPNDCHFVAQQWDSLSVCLQCRYDNSKRTSPIYGRFYHSHTPQTKALLCAHGRNDRQFLRGLDWRQTAVQWGSHGRYDLGLYPCQALFIYSLP